VIQARHVATALLILATLSVRVTSEPNEHTPEALARLIDRYRNGDEDRTVSELAKWDPADVEAAWRKPTDADDPKHLASAAMLHTEAGFRTDTFGEIKKDAPKWELLAGWGAEDKDISEPHDRAAWAAINELYKRAKKANDAGMLAFVREWLILTTSYCLRWERLVCAGDLLVVGELRYKWDTQLLLLEGSTAEAAMVVPGLGAGMGMRFGNPKFPAVSTSHGVFHGEQQEVEFTLKRVLRQDPTVVEAHLRLGRTMYLLDRNHEAADELNLTLRQARASHHVFATYLSQLFLGQLREHQGDMPAAIQFYRAALQTMPRSHSAAVALGQALVRSGNGIEGWRVARDMFGDEGLGVAPALDPWSIYRGGQYWQTASRVQAMRAVIRQ
jgi:tetratricopeptide (TPR) repeat protein